MPTKTKPTMYPSNLNWAGASPSNPDYKYDYVVDAYRDFQYGQGSGMDTVVSKLNFNFAKHCWHQIGELMDLHEACCWCGIDKLEYCHPIGHGKALGELKQQVDHTNEPCSKHNEPTVWTNQGSIGPNIGGGTKPSIQWSNNSYTASVPFSNQTTTIALN